MPFYSPFKTNAGSISIVERTGKRHARPVTKNETIIVIGAMSGWKEIERAKTFMLTAWAKK